MRSRIRKSSASLAAGVLALAGVALSTVPASAASADCIFGLYSSGAKSGPYIICAEVSGAEARARADCTAAPDTYTRWVREYDSSRGGLCLFGARGAIMQTRGL